MTVGDVVTGLRAAMEAPRWIASARLPLLLVPPAEALPAGREAGPALRIARRTLRLLSHLRPLGAPWENTCLLRSVAACLVCRRRGIPAVLKLGAAAAADSVTAHAWVEAPDGRLLAEGPLGHTAFRPSRP